MNNSTIAIIGAGNMGASLLGGLIATGLSPKQLWITDPDSEKLNLLQQKFNIQITQNNQEAVVTSDVIILAVKPNTIETVTQSLAKTIQTKKPLIISVAAGVTEKNLQAWLGGNIAIVRCMPNTPALIRCGATALYANQFVSHQQHELAESILRAVSVIVWLENEKQMDAVTALSGSGPAYFFLLMECLQQAGEKFGLPKETAQLLTLQTALGAARMALESNEPVAELRRRVTSPGGTTEAALRIFAEGKFDELCLRALQAAKKRSEELGEK